LMFVFEDISKFNDKDIQTVLKNVDNTQWALALKGASNDLKEQVFGNMSERAGDLLREEMEYLGGVRVSAVEAKQQEIVDIVRNLEDSGELDLSSVDEDEELLQ
jgi:flagellar motor switch protein FliG